MQLLDAGTQIYILHSVRMPLALCRQYIANINTGCAAKVIWIERPGSCEEKGSLHGDQMMECGHKGNRKDDDRDALHRGMLTYLQTEHTKFGKTSSRRMSRTEFPGEHIVLVHQSGFEHQRFL